MDEIWKDVEGYEGYYQVSNLGRVKSLGRWRKGRGNLMCFNKEKILKGKIDKDGYLEFGLSKDGKMKFFRSHRLVAFAFLENTKSLKYNQINHIDGNKSNNNPENLEWCDNAHNLKEALRLGLRGGKPYNVRIDARPFAQILNGEIIETFQSLPQAVRKTGIKKSAISNCLCGRSKSSAGYVWIYLEKLNPTSVSENRAF